jgi:hypothetical protein
VAAPASEAFAAAFAPVTPAAVAVAPAAVTATPAPTFAASIARAACGSTASVASKDAAHSWQHLGQLALAALAKVNGPSAAGATVRTLATAAFATAAADAPLVAPAKLAAAAPRCYPSHACQLCSHWTEGHRSRRRDGSIRLPALDGLICVGWPRRTVGEAA